MRINGYLLIAVFVALTLLAACAPATPTAAPAKPSPAATAAATSAGGPSGTAPSKATEPAAAPKAPTAENITRGGTMVRVVNNTWTTMDCHREQQLSSTCPLIMDYLTRYQYNQETKHYQVDPMLATSWKIVDPKTFVLELRKGVKFHDGSDFNADVAKWNIDRMLTHPKSMSKEYVEAIQSVDVVDPYTIRLNLKAPTAPLLINLSAESMGKVGMLSKAAATAHDDDWVNRNPVGTGPFKFAEWKTDDRVVVKRNENYWQMGKDGKPLPYLDEMVLRWIPEETVAVNELRTGNADLVELSSKTFVESLQNNPAINVSMDQGMTLPLALAVNMIKGRFKENVDLRKAAFYAIDRDALAKTLGKPGDEKGCYLLSEGQLGYDPSKVSCYTYDPAKSKEYLTKAGFPNGIDLTLIAESKVMDRAQAEILKNMLDKANMRTTIELLERTALVARRKSGDNWDLSTVGSKFNADPDITFMFRLSSGGSGNYGGWSDSEFDKCVEEGRSTYVDTERQSIYERCQQIVYDKAPFSQLWLQKVPIAMTKRVQGMRPYWLFIDFWGEFWLKK